MSRVSEVWGSSKEDGDGEINCMLSGLKGLMHNKYGDIILLCSVAVAFGMLLVVSATG